MSEKIDELLKAADPAKSLSAVPEGVFAAGPGKASRFTEWLALLTSNQRKLASAGAFALVVALGVVGTNLVPHTSTPLISLGASSNAKPTSQDVSQGKMAASVMLPWFQYEYRAAANFHGDSPSTAVYRLKLTGDPKSILTKLAKAFGVKGTVGQFDESSYGPNNFYVGSNDWSKPTVNINWSGTGSWSYSNPDAYPKCDSVATDTNTIDGCPKADGTIANPAFPSNEAAAAQAQQVFAAGGLDVPASEIKIYKDDYSMSASANLSVAGSPTALTWQVSWSATGELAYAFGQSVMVEKIADVATIDAKSAIARLSDWRWSGQPADSFYPSGPMVYGRMAADAVGSSVDGTSATNVGGGSSSASSGTAVSPSEVATPPDATNMPTEEPAPTPEVRIFSVTKASSALLLIYDADGNAWLVPGYFFEGDQGVAGAVLAVADGVIKLPDADTAVMPMMR